MERERTREWHTAAKELLPIVLACLPWGKVVRYEGVVLLTTQLVLNGGYSKAAVMMHLVH